MKILRSQYVQLQNNAYDQMIAVTKGEVGKIISNKGKEHVKEEETLAMPEERMLHGRNNIICFNPDTSSNRSKINIFFDNIDKSMNKLNVVLEFTDMSAMWLTSLYKTYENDLWYKKPRLDKHGNKKWFFYCKLCGNMYYQFGSIKAHLNKHLSVFPYVCKVCCNKYTGRKSAIQHLKTGHKLNRQQYNDFLTS